MFEIPPLERPGTYQARWSLSVAFLSTLPQSAVVTEPGIGHTLAYNDAPSQP